MHSRLTRTILTILFALTSVVCGLNAQINDEVIGKWKMTSQTPEGDAISWILQIKAENGKYSATIGTEQGEVPAKDFTVTESKVHLKTEYQGGAYDIDLKLTGAQLKGTWSGEGNQGPTTGTKTN